MAEAGIHEYLALHNENPKPFIWTATHQDSLAQGVGEAMTVRLLKKARAKGVLHPDGGGQNGLG